jgi:hypothetical protein
MMGDILAGQAVIDVLSPDNQWHTTGIAVQPCVRRGIVGYVRPEQVTAGQAINSQQTDHSQGAQQEMGVMLG